MAPRRPRRATSRHRRPALSRRCPGRCAIERGDRHEKAAVPELNATGNACQRVFFYAPPPQQFASVGVHAVDVSVHISEKRPETNIGNTAHRLHDHRRTDPGLRLISPVNTARLCRKRIDEPGVATGKQSTVDDGRLRPHRRGPWESECPLQLEPGYLLRGEPRGGQRLKPGIRLVGTPPVPTRKLGSRTLDWLGGRAGIRRGACVASRQRAHRPPGDKFSECRLLILVEAVCVCRHGSAEDAQNRLRPELLNRPPRRYPRS